MFVTSFSFPGSLNLDQFAKEDCEMEIQRSRGTACKVQAQLKQIPQDKGIGAKFMEK